MTDALTILSGPTMGTRFTVRAVVPPSAHDLAAQLQAVVDRIDMQMSNWKPDSTLSRFNTAPVGEWFEIDPELAEIVRIGLDVGALTRGAFDMTLGVLVDLWGFGPAGRTGTLPSDDQIATALAESGHAHLSLNPNRMALRRNSPLRLDLNGIAKGFAVDELARVLLDNDVANFIAEIDGELRVSGTRPDGSAWRIAVALPVPRLNAAYAALSPGAMAIATSGDYRHFFNSGGVQHHGHTIDSRTGHPAAAGLASATVLDPASCARADAIASALMVIGWDGARDWCEANAVSAVLLRRQDSEIEAQIVGPITLDRV